MRTFPFGRHNRLTTVALVASAAALTLSACSVSGGSGSTGGKVTLTFLSHYGQEPLKSGLTKLIDQWNSTHPDIQVKQQTVSFDDLLTTLNVRQTGGKGADILSSYALWGGQLAATGVLDKPSVDVASDIKNNYSQAAADAVTGDTGQVFGYPTEFNTYVLYYNKKILADAGYNKPPTNWAQLKEIAEKTTAKDSSGNYQIEGLSLIQDGDNQTAHPFLSLLDAAGGKLLDAKGNSALDAKAMSVMQLESELAKSGVTTTSIMPTKTFPSNRVAMAIQASWWIGSLKEQMKEDYANVGTAPVPGPEAGEKGSLAYAFFTGVNSGSKHKKEGWEFLTWLNSAKNKEGVTEMGDFLAGNGLIPPRKADAAILGPKLQAKDANLTPIYDAASYAMAESNAANAYKAKTSLHNSLNEILVNKAPVDQIFKSLASEINRK
ncbi:MAG: ABC transporter substrate-binding protein [Candidatus Lumbricidophila eiseniae]|uniref:ABC transporter substrate-binding protein n=1 Tax=Candidatus Lumbricidiphila eiseniae TaxID=1969409 RepID=A0A2A6FV35_9MICO|nr:MAG: ABC transporter substrate-binding protein [Candidatus Lumbricidophila eiseniae]